MSKTIKVKCNGPDQHINEIDIAKLFTPCFVMNKDAPCSGLPKRIVLDCRMCKEGKVIVTPSMIRAHVL
ncbi:hypothetical protein DENIS_2259 [Desulfonema ishimotonii]|uniref:Uncharacterized protein n=1 Tax=Desulfonema ishimotonii TaxID=45657 RepID=A0A401FWI1_9BACT|nr:hypothetical protein [Desulfonema ishimotonii]GBC61299.1 hypothetical protein DENIS_2259 [Desulfonema ishimotonii]